MPNNVIMRKIVLTANYQKLNGTSLVCNCDISCVPTNAADATFRTAEGQEVPWAKGEYHPFVGVDLNQIEVKGTPGDVVTVVGNTR